MKTKTRAAPRTLQHRVKRSMEVTLEMEDNGTTDSFNVNISVGETHLFSFGIQRDIEYPNLPNNMSRRVVDLSEPMMRRVIKFLILLQENSK